MAAIKSIKKMAQIIFKRLGYLLDIATEPRLESFVINTPLPLQRLKNKS